jgi:hypothetical protein
MKKVNLSKKKETVYVARCRWAVGTDVNGNDIVGFGLLWERKSYDEAARIVDKHANETYTFNGETRPYHTWVEQVSRYDDGSEDVTVVREYNDPKVVTVKVSGNAHTVYRVKWLDLDTSKTHEVLFSDELEAVHTWNNARLYVNLAPVSVATDDLRALGLEVEPADVTVHEGRFLVDGMTLADWSSAMTQD